MNDMNDDISNCVGKQVNENRKIMQTVNLFTSYVISTFFLILLDSRNFYLFFFYKFYSPWLKRAMTIILMVLWYYSNLMLKYIAYNPSWIEKKMFPFDFIFIICIWIIYYLIGLDFCITSQKKKMNVLRFYLWQLLRLSVLNSTFCELCLSNEMEFYAWN